MLVAFDTSVLVAGLREPHPHHLRAEPWLAAAMAGRVRAILPAQVLSEAYSTLTAVPGLRIRPSAANSLLARLLDHLEYAPVSLAAQRRALGSCTRLGLVSGAIFDAVIMATAEEAGAEAMVTFNGGDFERFRSAEGPRVIVPPDPPAVTV